MSGFHSNSTTESLRVALRQWCEALETLRITVAEDQPSPGESALADHMADDTDEVIGWVNEATASLGDSGDSREVHRLVGRALRNQGESLFGCVRHAHLEQLARGPDGPWRAWVSAVRSALEPLWSRTEDVVTRLALTLPTPTPATAPSTSRTIHRGDLVQNTTSLNQAN